MRLLTDEGELKKLFPLIFGCAVEVGHDISIRNEQKLLNSLKLCLDTGFILIEEKEDKIIAQLSCYSVECFWSDRPDKYINLFFQVLPEYRGRLGLKLIKKAKEITKGSELYMHDERMELGNLFLKNGFHKFSTTYKFEA